MYITGAARQIAEKKKRYRPAAAITDYASVVTNKRFENPNGFYTFVSRFSVSSRLLTVLLPPRLIPLLLLPLLLIVNGFDDDDDGNDDGGGGDDDPLHCRATTVVTRDHDVYAAARVAPEKKRKPPPLRAFHFDPPGHRGKFAWRPCPETTASCVVENTRFH